MHRNSPIIIGEIGCNHMGSMKLAEKLIKAASLCGANYVKFQKRDNRFLLGKKYDQPHPVKENSSGKSYGQHRDFLEFDLKQHLKLIDICKKNKIGYSTSVWEKKSARIFCKIQNKFDFIKVPSACNLDLELLDELCKNFKRKIHVSLGMTTEKEINLIFNFFKKRKRNKDLVFYHCTSDYPAKFEDLNLLNISKIIKKYKNKIHDVGFSGHHLGIAADVCAYTLGANYIERHITLDRTNKGTDHAASLEPSGLYKLIRDLKAINLCLRDKIGLLKNERIQRKKLKRIIKL